MPTDEPHPWATLAELNKWGLRNCVNCRYWNNDGNPKLRRTHCGMLAYMSKNLGIHDVTPLKTYQIIHGPRYTPDAPQYLAAPYHCASRKDKRGRHPNLETKVSYA